MAQIVTSGPHTGIVVIGRNEGLRLQRCLMSLPKGLPAVYVDSGSTDHSVAFAISVGVDVVQLDMRLPFTAARARNAGWRSLLTRFPEIEFIQFVDGDCEIAASWFLQAGDFLAREATLAAVFGRRRERFPSKSIYNQMCDDEWNVPVGLVASCGGDVLIRTSSLVAAGGYTEDLIAGEEPDLCLRLHKLGFKIRRIDVEMTLHDAAIYSFGSWWKRAKRSGYAYADHVWRHGAASQPQWLRQLASIIVWSVLFPGVAAVLLLLGFIFSTWLVAFVVILVPIIYTVQILRITKGKHSSGHRWGFALCYGALTILGKFAEITGVMKCWLNHFLNREQRIIEYKGTQ